MTILAMSILTASHATTIINTIVDITIIITDITIIVIGITIIVMDDRWIDLNYFRRRSALS